MRVTNYRVTAGKVSVECSDEIGAFEVAAKLTDYRHPSYSGSDAAQVDIVRSDGFWWTLGTANYGKPFKFPNPVLSEPAQQNPSFATQVAGDGTESGRSATDQGPIKCVAKPDRSSTVFSNAAFDVPRGWLKIDFAKMEHERGFPQRFVLVPVQHILEFSSDFHGVVTVKTPAGTYNVQQTIGEFAQRVSAAQAELLADLRGALEGVGVKVR